MQKPSALANLTRLAVGFVFGLTGIALYLQSSWEGIGPSLFFSFLLAFGARWCLLGLMGFVKPIPARSKTYPAALVCAVVLGGVGPSVSGAYLKGKEPGCWSKVIASQDEETWRVGYTKEIPAKFRRPEFLSRQSEAICATALKEKNFYKLRYQAQQAFQLAPDKYDEQARKTISASYHELFGTGLKLLKPTKLADPEMSQAFRQVLQALGEKPSRNLYFHFQAQGTLEKTPQDKQFFARISDPKVAKLPILGVGEAFSAEAQERRSGEVQSAIQKSLDSVWPAGLIKLEKAPKEARPDDVHFWVQAQVHRIPGFYVNSEGNTMTSLLFKCEVAWRFRVVVQGKELGSFDFRSEPAKHVSYSTKKDDPAWAPYSIVMDSAADSFARLIVGRLGMTPTAAPEHYTFAR